MPRHSVHRACDDFHQTAAAITRRQLIGRSLAAGVTAYMATNTPLRSVLEAAEASAAGAPGAPVLVSVFLPGGCDLLSTLSPTDQGGRLADLRGKLVLPSTPTLPGESRLVAHPALSEGLNGGIAGLFGQGKVGFLPGIDYANPDLSHFHSRHFWETGLITAKDSPGWLGRWLDRHGSAENPLQAVSVDGGLSPVLRTATAPVAAVSSPDDAQMWIAGTWGKASDMGLGAWDRLAARPVSDRPGPRAAATASRLTKSVADTLGQYRSVDNQPVAQLVPRVAYPENSDFADSLKSLAGMLDLPLGIRLATVEAPGDFDTHDNQPEDLGKALTDVSTALAAFQADLEARGSADRVLTFVWSEFGRRPEANDSDGTDHGAGGVAWVQGTRARGGILSDFPALDQLDGEGNLAVTMDFRRVYCSLIEQWLGTDAAEVIPNAAAFGRVALVR
ncbi:MAG: hypothetical protein QOG68_2658 [Solirubrobacteraceae bacterium]|nr:hypothetical protein [Solirubrobacteraceae bacterium]